jgi:FMN phosphatase YigB (HAD superfamily)
VPLRWVLFDLNGTLLDPSGIGEPVGLGAAESLAALDEAVMLAMAETLSGHWRPLPDFLRAALIRRAQIGGRPEGIDDAMQRASRMPPYPEAAAARAGVPPTEICMVAAHGWDLLGASRTGLRTGWVSRKERYFLETHPQPNASGTNLLALAGLLTG